MEYFDNINVRFSNLSKLSLLVNFSPVWDHVRQDGNLIDNSCGADGKPLRSQSHPSLYSQSGNGSINLRKSSIERLIKFNLPKKKK